LSRVTRYKIGYVIAFALVSGVVLAAARTGRSEPWVVFTIVLVLLLPGRIQGLLFRDLFRGRRDLERNRPESALRHFNSFLTAIRAQPWRKPALWLSWSIYTPNVEAMTQNNIGAAQLNLGNLDSAQDALNTALSLDPLYPLPHANLALVAALRADRDTAAHHLDAARRLGYKGAGLDRFASKTQSVLAAVESHGPAA
jgi:tetratricopeptide (TPR) repeat protein